MLGYLAVRRLTQGHEEWVPKNAEGVEDENGIEFERKQQAREVRTEDSEFFQN